MKTHWNHIKQQLLEAEITPLHCDYVFKIDNARYYSTYALDRNNKNLHILWTSNELESSSEVIAIDEFIDHVLFSHIDFDKEHLIVMALNKVLDASTEAVRIHYKDTTETLECINGYVINTYVCKTPNARGHIHSHNGNLLDDTKYQAAHYEFLINGCWQKGVGTLALTKAQILQIMLQSTGLKAFEVFKEEDFPVRSYPKCDFKEYINQIRFDAMSALDLETAIYVGTTFVTQTEAIKPSIDAKQQDAFDDRVHHILFSMFDHFWSEELSEALYEFSKQNRAYFFTIQNALSCLRGYEWVPNDLKRFGLRNQDF